MNKENDKFEITDEDIKEDEYSEDDLANEDKDWKEEAKELKGRTRRGATKLGKAKEHISALEKEIETLKPKPEEETPTPTPQDKKGLDLSQKTYLIAKGIEEDHFELVEKAMESTGKPIDEIVNNDYFKSDLENARTEKASRDASPEGGGGAGGEGDEKTVGHWLDKEGLPSPDGTPETTKLRGDIVKARIAKSKKSSL